MRPTMILPTATAALLFTAGSAVAQNLTPIEQLGKSIFFDQNLSINNNQSCAACHQPAVGWTGPTSVINEAGAVYEGSISGRFGNRKPPSSAYATQSPVFHYVIEKKEALFVGGNFWDGRATGETLGSPAAEQARGPFLNPLEQALPDKACVVYRVCTAPSPSSYPISFITVWGSEACIIAWPTDVNTVCAQEDGTVSLSSGDRDKVNTAYDNIARSIAAYEASPESNAFTSKYDYSFKGKAKLSKEEQRGRALFMGKGKCHKCHVGNGQQALFTDYTYDNLGIPRNPDNPFYDADVVFNPDGIDWVDKGLGGFLATRTADYAAFADANRGKQKVPTLRNVGKGSCEAEPTNTGCIVKAYGHNGYFKSLKGIVHFYNTRDVKPLCTDPFTTEAAALTEGCWPVPEVEDNVNTSELGNLGLTDKDEDAIAAFLMTLSDGYMPSKGPRVPR